MVSMTPWMLLIIHSIAVVAMAIFVGTRFSRSSEVAMAWTLFMLVDFPMGWLMIPLELWIGPVVRADIGEYAAGVLLPAVGFFVLGGTQYFCIGKLVVVWLARR